VDNFRAISLYSKVCYMLVAEGCGYAWSSAIANTNVLGGSVNTAASVDACMAACLANSNCIGIDWAPGNAASSQCYLTLTTSTGPRNNGTAVGVTHYDYIYSCSSSTGNTVVLQLSNVDRLKKTMHSWYIYPNAVRCDWVLGKVFFL
jgi:hypothetical protein